MQVQNNIQHTSFKAIMVPKDCQRRFMTALRQECNAEQLLRCVQVLEKEKTNANHVIVRDMGYIAGNSCNGHLKATVNNKSYWNSDSLFSFPTIPQFLEKMSKKAGKYLDKPQKLARKAQDLLNKKEMIETKAMRKEHIAKGFVTEEENRHYLLGEVYKLINYRPKN